MKRLSNLLLFASLVMVLLFQIVSTDAAALNNEQSSMGESSASEENNALLRNKKQAGRVANQPIIPSPLRRHHLKFGVLGKRDTYDYSDKRIDVPEIDDDFEDWLNNIKERRAGRPVYGLLG